MTRNLIEWYVRGIRRYAAWNMNTYVPWARRHEPYSFAIGPLVLGGGFLVFWLVFWLGFGLGPLKVVLYYLVPVVCLFLLGTGTGLWVRQQRRNSKPDQLR